MSLLILLDIKRICAVTRWKIFACSSGDLFALPSSLNYNNQSADG